ncbi:MAG: hypothetical protein EOP47_13475 [Sphingobacteriaceae bacterium]|nr:MAG: hypothetical protein EOP47_13475 [Sphingobacteriaceae bacterium]
MTKFLKLTCLVSIILIAGCTKDKSQQIKEQSAETQKRVNIPGITFSPASALYGSAITINGSFSTTPGANVVKINGVTGIINSVAADKIVVTVPVTATTGKISVTANSVTTTSATDFKVLKLVKEGSKPTGFYVNRLSFDRSGNGTTYFIGGFAPVVKKMTAAGVVSTIYSLLPGKHYGPNHDEYYTITDVENDGLGNVYFTRNRYRDTAYQIEFGYNAYPVIKSSVVLKINAAGQVSPFVGDGRGAKFWELQKIVLDIKGHNILLYHTALPNFQYLTKINQSGVAEEINAPVQNNELCPDEDGNYYTMLNYDLKKVSINGVVTHVAGSGVGGTTDGASDVARFYPSSTLAVDDNAKNIFVTNGGGAVRLVNAAGYVTTLPVSISSISSNQMYFNRFTNKLVINYRTEIHQYGLK